MIAKCGLAAMAASLFVGLSVALPAACTWAASPAAAPSPSAASVPASLRPWKGATPKLALPDARRHVQDLAGYRGRVVLVNFWATWCEPCRAEMPALARLQGRLPKEGFALLTVNVGDSPEKAAAFMQSVGLDLPVLFDHDSSVSRSVWKARLLPASFILDASGKIRYSTLGELNWDDPAYAAAIARLLPRKTDGS